MTSPGCLYLWDRVTEKAWVSPLVAALFGFSMGLFGERVRVPSEESGLAQRFNRLPPSEFLSRRGLLLLVAAALAFSMWFFVYRVWAPPPELHVSDIYPRWYGSRELLLRHRDPYSPAVTREIQTWFYGRALDPGEQRDQERFAYPLYIAFVLAPSIGLPFSRVENLLRVVLPLLAIAAVFLWVAMLRWHCSRNTLGSVACLSVASFPVLESIFLQQPVLLVGVLLSGAGAALTSGRLGLAGVLLAFATVKPQLSIPLVLWLLLWAATDWRARKNLVWGFGITMLVLAGTSELLLPGWPREFLAGLTAYQHYTGNFSILTLMFNSVGGTLASVGLAAAVAGVAWRMRQEPPGTERFNYGFCIILVVTVVVIPNLYPTGQIILLPAVFLVLKNVRQVWAAGRALRLALVATSCLIAWPWVSSFAYLLASPIVPLSLLRRFWIVPVSTILLIPLGLLMVFAIQIPLLLGGGGLRPASSVSGGSD